MARIQGKSVVEESPRVYSLLIQRGFGEKSGKSLVLDFYEAMHLLRAKKIKLENAKGKIIAEKEAERELLEAGAKSVKGFAEKLCVYEDLRKRGRVPRTGFKFGFDFRVYPQGRKPGESHTEFVVFVVTQGKSFSAIDLARMSRASAGIKARLLVAVVDSEREVSYYEFGRAIP